MFYVFPTVRNGRKSNFQVKLLIRSGSPTRARTWDLRINSPSLYQLSYRGFETPENELPEGVGRRVF